MDSTTRLESALALGGQSIYSVERTYLLATGNCIASPPQQAPRDILMGTDDASTHKMRDDEKELVLGNKQLLSLFFVAAALCGVCFALGYMMGRNATKATLTAEQTAAGVVDGHRTQPSTPTDTPLADPPQTTVVETRPAQDPVSATPTPTVEPKVEEKTPEPRPTTTAPKAYDAKARPEESLGVSTPEGGTSYLQVAALPRPDAEGMVKTLREQHFPVIMAVSSKAGRFRILVGPYKQTVQLSDAKSKLKALGFNDVFVQKQ